MKPQDQQGMALITVLVVLASMALLMSGVYTLVSDNTRSAVDQVRYQAARGSGESGMGQLASLINRVAVPNFKPPAPPGYGVQWTSRQAFGDYIRGQAGRGGAAGAPAPCEQDDPDIQYTVSAQQENFSVAACIDRVSAGAIAGTSGGMVFARTSKGTADSESLLEVTIWVTGARGEIHSQHQATMRAFH